MHMPDILQIGMFFGILFSGELIATLLFLMVNRSMKRGGLVFSGVIRGILERAFLYFAMVNGIFHAMTLFGALKIATRIKDDDKVSNDYFLIGNLISVFAAIGYFLLHDILLSEFV